MADDVCILDGCDEPVLDLGDGGPAFEKCAAHTNRAERRGRKGARVDNLGGWLQNATRG